ncbi:anti-sigma factor [Cnuibacter physcomitrellae]|uniref:anti-sigma factor n=1 Tax=Cnuibacter physcomitrellae TaxID=1619308 RepID=UPI002175D775|nr:anti-sigma factor [Cnuibacter physcomitrellae]MCS5495639.1 anti-sigma factor [Cnuibacter physcomitrellae]
MDPERLALIALADEQPTSEERLHLESCAACAAELAGLSRTVGAGREADGVAWEEPSPAVWERIRTELGFADAPATSAPGAESALATPAASASGTASASGAAPASVDSGPSASGTASAAEPAPALAPVPPLPPSEEPGSTSNVRPLRRRSARFWAPLVAAAAVVGLLAGAAIGRSFDPASSRPTASVVATAELDAFPGWPGAHGTATVEQLADGSHEVVVDVDAQATDAPLREVWLMRGDGSGLISIGFMDGTEGRFSVPAGITLADYPLVDISAEPDNGDPGHSGDSIVRGELRPA